MALFPDYATLAELRAFVRITDVTDTAEDAQLSMAISAASRVIDHATKRQFGVATSATARYFTPGTTHGRPSVAIDDLMTQTSLVVKSDLDNDAVYETTVTDYRMWPLNSPDEGRPWREIVFGPTSTVGYAPGSIEVTALWGWTSVPTVVKEACLIQASRIYKRRDSPYGVAGSPEMGNEMRLLSRLDPDVDLMLQEYRIWRV